MPPVTIYATTMLAAGVGIPILAALNAALGQRIGAPIAASTILFCVALLTTLAALLISGGVPHLAKSVDAPKHLFFAGCLVAFYVLSITLVAPKFGVGNAVFFVLLGQLISAAAIGLFGLFGAQMSLLSLARAGGPGVVAAGGLRMFDATRPLSVFDQGVPAVFLGGALIFVAFEGFQLITSAVLETEDAERNVPRGIYGSILITSVIYIAIALVAVAAATDWTGIKRKQAHINANTLVRANIKSIATRYPDLAGNEIESFYTDGTEKGYRADVKVIIDAMAGRPDLVDTEEFLVDTARAAADFDYQACEFDSYPRSKAYLIQLNAAAYAGYKLAELVGGAA